MTDYPKNKTITEAAVVARYGPSAVDAHGRWLDSLPDAPGAATANPPCAECAHYAAGFVCNLDGSMSGVPWKNRWREDTDPAPACFTPKRSKREELARRIREELNKRFERKWNEDRESPFTELMASLSEIDIIECLDAALPAKIGGEDDD